MFKKILLTLAVLAMTAACFAEKNVILIVSDGTGINAISMYEQFVGHDSIMRSFPTRMFCTTYSHGLDFDSSKAWKDADAQIPDMEDYLRACTDSAASATAINSGRKTYNGHVNLFSGLVNYDTVALAAKRAGYRVADVTTVSWADATPAGVSSHSIARGSWNPISHELLSNRINDVLGGGGNPWYHTDGTKKEDPSYNVISKEDWDDVSNGITRYKLLENREDIQALANDRKAKGFYVFSPKCSGDMPIAEHVPTTAEMAIATLNVLKNNSGKDGKGFFFMLEEGRPDHANHANNGENNVAFINALDDAVRAIVAWVNKNSNWKDTMLIVTADHETGGIRNSDKTYFITSNGAGNMPNYEYTTGGHTNTPVPFFVKGGTPGLYNQFVRGVDPVLGKYIDNTDISKGIEEFMHLRMLK
ncbi:MAG: alkaline phosphatase [Abditibacteriota bacterium]|nr:alkaline phosphatase [Abditibacteriota bacterium]